MVYLGIIGQFAAAVLSVSGLTLMISQHAPWPYILMTGSAIVFSVFTKIRLIGYERGERITYEKDRLWKKRK